MKREPLIDVSTLDSGAAPFLDIEGIEGLIPHRHEMRMLDHVLSFSAEDKLIVGRKILRDDEFWVRGHIPGRPLFPGVLMIECAAQLCTLYYHLAQPDERHRFIGMAAVDDVRFRAAVVPGQEILFVARNRGIRSRAAYFDTQAFVDGRIIFEGSVTGVEV